MVDIRLCSAKDIDGVRSFIESHWAPGHVLARHKPLMDWQHRDCAHPDRYHWILAERGGDLLGLLGFIPTRHFDPALSDRSVAWLSLWKVRDDAGVAGLGLRLLKTLEKLEPHAAVGVLGINPAHPPMYRALGYETGELAQHALFHPGRQRRLAVVPEGHPVPAPRAGDAALRPVDAAGLADAWPRIALGPRARAVPAKSAAYLAGRYLKHPVYRYDVRLIEAGGVPLGVLVCRVAEHEGSRALRIVDFLGDSAALSRCGTALGTLLEETGAEYADLWEHGLGGEALRRAGFARVERGGPMVVPNHFEPFTGRPGRIEFAIRRPAGTPLVILRGDGDQDRPNIVPEGAAA